MNIFFCLGVRTYAVWSWTRIPTKQGWTRRQFLTDVLQRLHGRALQFPLNIISKEQQSKRLRHLHLSFRLCFQTGCLLQAVYQFRLITLSCWKSHTIRCWCAVEKKASSDSVTIFITSKHLHIPLWHRNLEYIIFFIIGGDGHQRIQLRPNRLRWRPHVL